MRSNATAHNRAGELWLLALGLLSVSVSLVVRIVHRGPYFPGCDLWAAAQGYLLASTYSFWGALKEVFYQNRHYWLPWPMYSVPFSLIPGYLERLWPWQYWAHVTNFSAFVLTLILLLRAVDLPLRRAGIVLLGWGASPMLLSYSIVGEPWGSGFLAQALALWVTMSRSLRQRWALTLVWALVATELSWHVYEAGKLVGVVFLAAVFLQPNVPRLTRGVWLLAGASQLVEALVLHRTANIKAFAFQRGGGWAPVGVNLHDVVEGLRVLGDCLITFELDLPILLGLGVASFFFFKRDRWLVLALLLFNLGLQLLLAMYGRGNMRPRRFMIVDWYCLVAIACAYRDGGRLPRAILVGVLLLGNLWQADNLRRFMHAPHDATFAFFMPYTHSSEGVGLVEIPEVDLAGEVRARVESGERILLLYNLACYQEGMTNWDGVLERLYLSLGHERFVQSVLVFGSEQCRYNCLPIRPLNEFEPFLDGVRPDGPTPPATLVGYYPANACKGPGMDAAELDQMFATIRKRFDIRLESPPDARYLRFRIEGLNSSPPRDRS